MGMVVVSKTITPTEGGYSETLDISYDGITSALTNGKIPTLIYEEEGTTYYQPLVATYADAGSYYNATFGAVGTTQYEADTSTAMLSATLG